MGSFRRVFFFMLFFLTVMSLDLFADSGCDDLGFCESKSLKNVEAEYGWPGQSPTLSPSSPDVSVVVDGDESTRFFTNFGCKQDSCGHTGRSMRLPGRLSDTFTILRQIISLLPQKILSNLAR